MAAPDVESLAGLEKIWPAFLEQVGGSGPRFLLLQMKRCVLKEFENDTLLLAVDNDFGLRMVQEHTRQFTDILTAMLGRRIRILVRVERGTSPAAASKDPYEEFREVLRKDPVARELVELFGAELRYDV